LHIRLPLKLRLLLRWRRLLLLLGGRLLLIVRVYHDGSAAPGRAVNSTYLCLCHRGRENHGDRRDRELGNDDSEYRSDDSR